MPLLWHNLSYLITELISLIFSTEGSSSYTIRVAAESLNNLISHTYLYVVKEISEIISTLSPISANTIVKDFFNRYIIYLGVVKRTYYPDDDPDANILTKVAFIGKFGVRNGHAYISKEQVLEDLIPQTKYNVSFLITAHTWYAICVPQMLSWFIYESTFRKNTKMKEYKQNNKIGLNMDEFKYFVSEW